MFKFLKDAIIAAIIAAIQQRQAQIKLNRIIGEKKKSDYIKVNLPKKYIAMIELIAMYGIEDSAILDNIIKKHMSSF